MEEQPLLDLEVQISTIQSKRDSIFIGLCVSTLMLIAALTLTTWPYSILPVLFGVLMLFTLSYLRTRLEKEHEKARVELALLLFEKEQDERFSTKSLGLDAQPKEVEITQPKEKGV